MSEYDWKQEVRQWVDKCRHATPDLADKLIRFFELAFAGTRYPEEAWFGAHGSTVSLVVGGIFLAAVVSSGDNRGLWLLVDEKLQPIEGIDYRPVKSTQNSETPLVWLHGWPLEAITRINGVSKIWDSYSQASEKIFNSPQVSASRDEFQIKRSKRNLTEFWRSDVRVWEYASFREELGRRSGANLVQAFDRFYEWSSGKQFIDWRGSSLRIDEHATLWPWIEGGRYPPFCFRVDGRVEIPFRWINQPINAPFDAELRCQELRDRLNDVPGIEIESPTLRDRPTFPLSVLEHEGVLNHLCDVFVWYAGKMGISTTTATAELPPVLLSKVIEQESRIRESQKHLLEGMASFTREKIPVKLGFRGGRIEGEVSWCADLGIWTYSRVIPGRRYWNAFGIGKPAEGRNVSITCEINFPLKDIDRRVAGAFVMDSLGNVYVVHRGRIGGGRAGIGKSLFEQNYRGDWLDIEDGEKESTVALVGALSSPRFARQVRQFVFEVDRMKGLLSASATPSPITIPETYHDFRKEFAGKKRYETKTKIEAQCDHGLIVNSLASDLESLGFIVGNDRNRDLYIIDSSNRVMAIFEVKTGASTSSLYSGVGQLMLYSVDLIKPPRLILVLPEGVSTALEGKLNKLGVELLVYGWSGDGAVFHGLNSLSL